MPGTIENIAVGFSISNSIQKYFINPIGKLNVKTQKYSRFFKELKQILMAVSRKDSVFVDDSNSSFSCFVSEKKG